jgi:hypothetical protein
MGYIDVAIICIDKKQDLHLHLTVLSKFHCGTFGTFQPGNKCHRIGWWENLQETPIFSCRFSLQPIHWECVCLKLGYPVPENPMVSHHVCPSMTRKKVSAMPFLLAQNVQRNPRGFGSPEDSDFDDLTGSRWLQSPNGLGFFLLGSFEAGAALGMAR